MSTAPRHPARHNHRTQIVAEAVVAAYIDEISPRRRTPVRPRGDGGRAAVTNKLTLAPVGARAVRRPLRVARPAPLELV